MTTIAVSPLESQSVLGAFLRTLRRRIPPGSDTLGPSERLPIRRGRRVTQEEVAEVVGVSRNWYRRLESGSSIRASNKLLARLACALAMTTGERITLFALAVPELFAIQPLAGSNATDRALTVRQIGALPDLDSVTVGIADVAANLAVLGNRFREELGSSTLHNS
jgi:transcriptional regulator with XRE-family HTH domain